MFEYSFKVDDEEMRVGAGQILFWGASGQQVAIDSLGGALAELGQEGWEMVNAIHHDEKYPGPLRRIVHTRTYYFKRPLPE